MHLWVDSDLKRHLCDGGTILRTSQLPPPLASVVIPVLAYGNGWSERIARNTKIAVVSRGRGVKSELTTRKPFDPEFEFGRGIRTHGTSTNPKTVSKDPL